MLGITDVFPAKCQYEYTNVITVIEKKKVAGFHGMDKVVKLYKIVLDGLNR